jgi:chorismate mutase
MNNQQLGGWELAPAVPCTLPGSVEAGFAQAVKGLKGARYIPVLYAGHQVVNGINHAVLCQVTLVTLDPQTSLKLVYLHEASVTGEYTLTNIADIDIRT